MAAGIPRSGMEWTRRGRRAGGTDRTATQLNAARTTATKVGWHRPAFFALPQHRGPTATRDRHCERRSGGMPCPGRSADWRHPQTTRTGRDGPPRDRPHPPILRGGRVQTQKRSGAREDFRTLLLDYWNFSEDQSVVNQSWSLLVCCRLKVDMSPTLIVLVGRSGSKCGRKCHALLCSMPRKL